MENVLLSNSAKSNEKRTLVLYIDVRQTFCSRLCNCLLQRSVSHFQFSLKGRKQAPSAAAIVLLSPARSKQTPCLL